MQLKEPQRKKYTNFHQVAPLPIIDSFSTEDKCKGVFDGFSVSVHSPNHIKVLISRGFFGKGNLSRSFPKQDGHPPIIRQRQFSHRQKLGATSQIKKVIVVPDTDSENDDYFTNFCPKYEIDASGLQETLNLSLEEAFFLSYAVRSLDIYDSGTLLGKNDLWKLFCETDPYFVQNYVVYHHFRSKNWVVKPGLKFGGDFLLYKEGPAFYHASYVVIIDVLDETTMERKEESCRRSMDVTAISGLNRICETAGKELLICQIIWPSNLTSIDVNDLPKLSVTENLMRRWIASQKRNAS